MLRFFPSCGKQRQLHTAIGCKIINQYDAKNDTYSFQSSAFHYIAYSVYFQDE